MRLFINVLADQTMLAFFQTVGFGLAVGVDLMSIGTFSGSMHSLDGKATHPAADKDNTLVGTVSTNDGELVQPTAAR